MSQNQEAKSTRELGMNPLSGGHAGHTHPFHPVAVLREACGVLEEVSGGAEEEQHVRLAALGEGRAPRLVELGGLEQRGEEGLAECRVCVGGCAEPDDEAREVDNCVLCLVSACSERGMKVEAEIAKVPLGEGRGDGKARMTYEGSARLLATGRVPPSMPRCASL